MFASTSAKFPPQKYCRIIQEMLVVLGDPVDKLTLLHRVLAQYGRIPFVYKIYPHWMEIALRKMVLAEAEKIRPESRPRAIELIKQGVISTPRPLLWKLYHLRHVIISMAALLLVGGLSLAAAALYDFIQPPRIGMPVLVRMAPAISPPMAPEAQAIPAHSDPDQLPMAWFRQIAQLYPPDPPLGKGPIIPAEQMYRQLPQMGVADPLKQPTVGSVPQDRPLPARTAPPVASATAEARPDGASETNAPETHWIHPAEMQIVAMPEYLEKPIWLVEKTRETELYSNRLHVITTHTIDNIPRKYLRFPRGAMPGDNTIQATQRVGGIVFHTSESDLFPFSPEMNNSIKNNTAKLIQYLRRNKSYNYFIDRFGRVYRIVREDHAAFHAGHAVWSDSENYYLNLNHAFIGICFEGRDFEMLTNLAEDSQADAPMIIAMSTSSINEAQLVSGKELTDWLRVKYHIHERNCVPHGLVSINPHEKLIGRHLDLSHGFPFERFGLNDKYQSLLPSIVDFGFSYDRFFENIFQGNPWPGARRSMALLNQLAREKQVNLITYQKSLWDRFDAYYALERGLKGSDSELVKKNEKVVPPKSARNQ
jgi:hypothetical protein